MFKENLLQGKRILVTGGGTGLGKVMAEQYVALGADVYILGRRGTVVEETAKELMDAHPGGGKVKAFACDIRVAEAVHEVIDDVWQDGPLTGLVNNAAGNFISRTQDLSPRGFDAIANIVFHGTFYMTHDIGKRWIEQGLKGNVISILVTWIWNGSPFVVPSAMSKAGLHAMTQSLAVEWAPFGIRLNAIAPGPFPTKGAGERLNPKGSDGIAAGAQDATPMGRVGEMPELANLATFLMSDGCDFLTGQTLAIDGGAWQANGGNFSGLASLSDEDWQNIREVIKSVNDKDKAQRSV